MHLGGPGTDSERTIAHAGIVAECDDATLPWCRRRRGQGSGAPKGEPGQAAITDGKGQKTNQLAGVESTRITHQRAATID